MNKITWRLCLQKSRLPGYLGILAIAILYALFIDIHFGLTFAILYLTVPICFDIVCWLALKDLRLGLSLSATVLTKKAPVQVTVSYASGNIPLPAFLELRFQENEHFLRQESGSTLMALGQLLRGAVEQTYTAMLWGESALGLSTVVVWDYFGIVRFEATPESLSQLFSARVRVLPDIPATGRDELFRSLLESEAADEEEGETETLLSPSGTPGFEHRAYEPGDLLRRVNWKLSARLDEYMVRLPEPDFILRLRVQLLLSQTADDTEDNRALLLQERLTEASLAFLRVLVASGRECVFVFALAGATGSAFQYEMRSDDDIAALQYWLSGLALPLMPLDVVKPMPGSSPLAPDTKMNLVFTNEFLPAESCLRVNSDGSGGGWFVTSNFAFIREK
jgi:hypothetical protein